MLNKSLYNVNSFYHDVLSCGHAILGQKETHPNVDFNWKSSEKEKFLNWESNRIWCIEKGTATVETIFGKFNLMEKNVYYIPNGTLISTSCDDYMEQYFIDFITHSEPFQLENIFSFNYVSNNYNLITQLVKDVINDRQFPSPLSNLRSNANITAIIVQFIKHQKLIIKEKALPFLDIMRYINEHYNDDLSISHLAKTIGYTSDHFARTFKSIFKVTPQAYIKHKRLSIAKHLLITTDYSISSIAFKCGYKDPLYFTKLFTSQIKVTPTKYRTLINEKIFSSD